MLAEPGPPNWQDPLHVSASGPPELSELGALPTELTQNDPHAPPCAECVRLEAALSNAEGAYDGSAATDCRVLIRRHLTECPENDEVAQ